jgi:hypothetical protein
MDLIAAKAADLARVQTFLKTAFGPAAGDEFDSLDHLRWKYLDPRPDWEGSRSFLLTLGDRIAAHACVCPLRLGTRRCFTVIDWVADPAMPGSGLMMSTELSRRFGIRLGVGDNKEARISPRPEKRYEHFYAEIALVRRVVRPLSRVGNVASALLRDPLRRVKDIVRYTTTTIQPVGDWSAVRVETLPGDLDGLWDNPAASAFTPCWRSAELLNYMLRCPAAAFSAYLLYLKGRIRGHLLLAELLGEARVADVFIDSDDLFEWSSVYALATETVEHKHLSSHTVTAAACPPLIRQAVEQAGFDTFKTTLVVAPEPALLPGADCLPHFNLMDWDAAYLK